MAIRTPSPKFTAKDEPESPGIATIIREIFTSSPDPDAESPKEKKEGKKKKLPEEAANRGSLGRVVEKGSERAVKELSARRENVEPSKLYSEILKDAFKAKHIPFTFRDIKKPMIKYTPDLALSGNRKPVLRRTRFTNYNTPYTGHQKVDISKIK